MRKGQTTALLSFFFFFFALQYWGLNSGPPPWTLHQPFFVKGFFEIRAPELFAGAGFEL
jgi:hypothetical protein